MRRKSISKMSILLFLCISLLLCSCGAKNDAGKDSDGISTVKPGKVSSDIAAAKGGLSTPESTYGGEARVGDYSATGGSAGHGSTGEPAADGYTSGGTTDAGFDKSEDMSSVMESSEPIVVEPGEDIWPIPTGIPQPQARAGLLTAGEWNDNENWDFFRNLMRNQGIWWDFQEQWSIYPVKRIAVTVTGADGTPLQGAKVTLSDSEGSQLAAAVSDHKGQAYLFWNLEGGEGNAPATVEAVFQNDVASLTLSENDLTAGSAALSLAQSTKQEKKLDLMLVFDTTGSMGDELNYLQVELEDVIETVKRQNANIPVRLSVNFYRDLEDDYVVRDFAFTTDMDMALNDLRAQNANGGGDYEEAVELALENAIRGHEWDADSVKIMFLLLDAPPHYSSEIESSLKASIAKAAEMGIRIIPIASSGVDQNTEFLLRTLAATSGGTYAFLTDDSGVGGSHLEPTIGDYEVEKLNELMVRLIGEYLE